MFVAESLSPTWKWICKHQLIFISTFSGFYLCEVCLSVGSRLCASEPTTGLLPTSHCISWLAGFTVLDNLSYLWVGISNPDISILYQILHSPDACVGRAVNLWKYVKSCFFWHNEFVTCCSVPAIIGTWANFLVQVMPSFEYLGWSGSTGSPVGREVKGKINGCPLKLGLSPFGVPSSGGWPAF